MSRLADQILRGQTHEARALAEAEPSSMSEFSTGPEKLFPADIALRCGRHEVLTLLLRLGAPMKVPRPSQDTLLRHYLDHISDAYFCAGRMDGLAASVWEQLYEGREYFFDGQDPEFGLSDSEKQDFRWLLETCGIRTKEALLRIEGE